MKKISIRKPKINVELLNAISLLLHLVGSFVICFFIEVISRNSLSKAAQFLTGKPLVFFYNMFLIFTTTCLVYLFRRRCFMRVLIFGLWLMLGIINGIVLSVRVTPFTGPDILNLFDGLKLITLYLTPMAIVGIVIGILLVIGLFVMAWLKAPKYQGPLSYKKIVPLVLAVCLLFWGSTVWCINNRVLSTYFGNIAFAYEDYGFPYCLGSSIFATGMDAPNGYSQESIERIIKSQGEPEENVSKNKQPNLIFLQLESFFDPKMVEFLKLSEDPIPNFRRLMREYSSGYFKVPSVGAGTANTEFECITGMNLRYFGPGEYPYKTILKKQTCESMAYDLKELGYASHAIHNNTATFYNRLHVFSQLGFDTFTSLEYMNVQETTPMGWAKDRILTSQILNALDSTEGRDYIYTISVQGHGEYPEEPVLEDPHITVTGIEEEEKRLSWEYYVNEVYEMDQFVGELIQELENYGEDVILIMYGDHLPTMDLRTSDLKNRYLFQTQYVIWDNMGLEKENQNIASYQAASVVLEKAGIHSGTIFRYHQTRRKTKNYLLDLEELQYDLLYGKQYVYGKVNPYEATTLKMGVQDIMVYGVRKSAAYGIIIEGKNFTDNSKVEINGTSVDTVKIDSNYLKIEEQVQIGDKIRVNQVATEGRVLSSSNQIIFRKYKDN